LSGSWPSSRLIETWNTLPRVTLVRKFTDRKTAVARIWKAIQSLVPAPETDTVKAPATSTTKAGNAIRVAKDAKVAKEKPVRASKAKMADKPATARDGSKKARIWNSCGNPTAPRWRNL